MISLILIVILSICGDQVIGKTIAPIGNTFSNVFLFYATESLCDFFFSISIGAIFEDGNINGELAFQSAIFRENMYNKDIEFVPKVIKVANLDTFVIERQGNE